MNEIYDEEHKQDDERLGEPVSVRELAEGVMARIAARQAAGEIQPPPPPDATAEDRAAHDRRVMRLLDRKVPRDAAEVIAGGTLRETKAIEHARAFMAGPPGVMILTGGVGCGKTMAMSWCVAQKSPDRYVGTNPNGRDGLWPPELQPRYLDASELLWLPRYSDKAAMAMQPLLQCSLLAIDDVGVAATEALAPIIDALVVQRTNSRLRTIMTTNMSLTSFIETFGERVRDRLRGSQPTGGYFGISGGSLRGQP